MKYDAAKHEVRLEGVEFGERDKEYQFRLVAETVEDPHMNDSFRLHVSTTFFNTPPSFLTQLPDQLITRNTLKKWKLPWILDAQNDQVTKVLVKLGSNAGWLKYDAESMSFEVDGSNLPPQKAGLTKIPILLED